jgi:hypothetical protein
MRWNVFFTLFILCFPTLIIAQNVVDEYRLISDSELQTTTCPYDEHAEAVVLTDIGSCHFEQTDNDFDVVFERITRIKILKDAGVKWAKAEIPFYRHGEIYEEIDALEGCTYNIQNGNIIRTNLDLSTTYTEKINEWWSLKKFAMPNVKVGSIVEIRYRVRSEYIFKLRDWEFQWKIPVLYSKFSIRMIPFYQYAWLLQGASKFDSQQTIEEDGLSNSFGGLKYNNVRSEYVMKNLTGFKDEEYISSINDYIIKLHFQLARVTQTSGISTDIVSTWPQLVKDFLEEPNFNGYIKKSQSVTSKIFNLKDLESKTSLQKFDTVMNYVKTQYKWNSSNGKYATKSVNSFMKDKQGNVAELNLFAIGLLNSVGINATPVVLSTRSHGKVYTQYPLLDAFNYVAISAEVDGKTVLTDATDINSSNFRIPQQCINGSGLLIKKDKTDWIPLQFLLPSTTRTYLEIELANDSLKSTIRTSATEYEAINLREKFGSDSIQVKKSLEQRGYNIIESSVKIKNATDYKKPYIYQFSTDNPAEKINNKIYISPFYGEIIQENPLKQSVRTYPIDLIYPIHKTLHSKIRIPDGYKFDFIPLNKRIDNDQFLFDYATTISDDIVIISLQYFFKSPLYDSSEYNRVKLYFNEIVTKSAEKIVISKL